MHTQRQKANVAKYQQMVNLRERYVDVHYSSNFSVDFEFIKIAS